jgi:hypothetical protein
LDAISAPAVAEHAAAIESELVCEIAPWARATHAQAQREAARERMQHFEKLMRAPQGSPEWKSYWQDPAAQQGLS